MATNDSDTGDRDGLLAEAKAMTASPLLYVGAITVVLGLEIAESLPLSDPLTALALLPIALALLYGQLAFVALLRRRRGDAAGCA